MYLNFEKDDCMSRLNLTDEAQKISKKFLEQNAEFIASRISGIIEDRLKKNPRDINDMSKIIGYAACAGATTAVELSAAMMLEIFAKCELIEHDGHPNLRVLK